MVDFIEPKKESLNFPKQVDDASWAYKNKISFIKEVYFKRLKMIMSLVDNPFNKVLDIGTGCGILLPSISRIARDVYGGDICLLKNTKFLYESENLKNVKIIYTDVFKIPFKDGVFDAVFCVSVLEHVSNLKHAINELKRVLKKNGYVFLGYPIDETITKLGYAFGGVLEETKSLHVETYKDIREGIKKEFKIVKRKKLPSNFPDIFSLYEVVKLQKL